MDQGRTRLVDEGHVVKGLHLGRKAGSLGGLDVSEILQNVVQFVLLSLIKRTDGRTGISLHDHHPLFS